MQLFSYLGAPLPLIFALFLSEVHGRKFRKIVQTISVTPNFISWVLVYAVAFSMFSFNEGFVNKLLLDLGIIDTKINFLVDSRGIWFKMWLWRFWKSCGWSAVIYFAAIAGINQELYEAAKVDGAGRFRKMWIVSCQVV